MSVVIALCRAIGGEYFFQIIAQCILHLQASMLYGRQHAKPLLQPLRRRSETPPMMMTSRQPKEGAVAGAAAGVAAGVVVGMVARRCERLEPHNMTL